MPTCFGYIRVSGEGQAQSGLGEDSQEEGIKRLYELLVKPTGLTLEPQHIIRDLAVSAGKVEFRKRSGGGWLFTRVDKGDAIIFYKLDRAFRNLEDMLVTLRDLDKRGVKIYSVDFGGSHYDSTSMIGRTVAVLFGLMAEMEYGRILERNRDRSKASKLSGRAGGHCPYGFHAIKRDQSGRKGKWLHPDDKERFIMGALWQWKQQGHNYARILKHCRTNAIYNPRSGKPLTFGRVSDMIQSEDRLRSLEASAKIHLGQFVTPDGVLKDRVYPIPECYLRDDWGRPPAPSKSEQSSS